MDFSNILSGFLGGQSGASQSPLNTLVGNISPETIQKLLASALNSDQTPPTGQTLSRLFDKADAPQKAGLLSEVLGAIDPKALAGLAGGAFQALAATGGTVTPAQAARFTPQQVAQLADGAAQAEPGIIERVSKFCAEHPTMLSLIGTSVMAVVANSLKQGDSNKA
ncbi:hypothetical protein [Xylophilus sp. GOD-11R]|uniref:hypothetical protein n=1 Tax=Xylophilus sp. GOD-11R TaxID=3089814 RepID=UPI00298CFFC5|nr:hypothetical protein [Xylophilus sp. GOD-11R]WPB58790.1 hypothetical protein R9X41_09175 [Xylophilus sp. GOD-11R]